MKKYLAIAGVTLLAACANPSTSSVKDSQESHEAPAKWVCNEIDRSLDQLKQRTVVLTQTGGNGLKEGEQIPFAIEIFEGTEMFTERIKGHVETEDVFLVFKSDDGSLKFTMFLDELDQSSLKLVGKEPVDFLCR